MELETAREMVTNFQGLNDTLRCIEGEFRKMKNVTTQYYPVLSTRNKRNVYKTFTNLQGILDKDSLVWVDDKVLYIDGVAKSMGDIELLEGKKELIKMGAFIVILPDKVWYNAEKDEYGKMDAEYVLADGGEVTFTLCNTDGTAIEWHDEAYYKSHAPKSGDYMMTTTDTKTSLKVFSELTNMWSAVTTTYMKIGATGIGKNFKKDDGIKITIDNSSASWDYAKKIFVNEEEDGRLSINTWIKELDDDYISIIALLDVNKTFTNLPMTIERKMPDIAYITECQNRLWGCSKDGHEIYCCKLGDVTNWTYYSGTSLDSYAATVGSDGEFTGAVTYNQNPIFFKENSYIKVTVSASGAHSYREQFDRGVQKGSHKSICNVDGIIVYKGVTDVYAYDGSPPQSVGEKLGEHRYFDAVGGTIDGRYYISMKDKDDVSHLFVYDIRTSLWAEEDNTKADFFVRNHDELYFAENNILYSTNGTEEKPFKWLVESGAIGFSYPDSKYVGRLNIRMSLEQGAYADFWIMYDSDSVWHHVFQMSGKGTKSFTIPVTPRRCDHFAYRLSGQGGCKIYSITKTLEQGSDT